MQLSPNALEQILSFTHQVPKSTFHSADMPYRLCSPAAQEPANRRVWTSAAGEVTGFGVTQLPFSTLDWAVRPGYESLQQEIVAWGVGRLEEIARQRGKGFGYLLDSRSDNDAVAVQYGFKLDDWCIRNLAIELSHPPRTTPLPNGFRIRPLNGEAEVSAYVDLHRAAFDTRNMSVEWRAKTLGHPLYQPELDLVAESDDGQLVAFCIGWLNKVNNELVGQIEPLGVLPAFQRRGLGRAILSESLHRFYQAGVRRVLIDAESYNDASQSLYERSGFTEVARTYKYFRRF
jgi:ribosomal protein S18 acetylase RimI-like enzyme